MATQIQAEEPGMGTRTWRDGSDDPAASRTNTSAFPKGLVPLPSDKAFVEAVSETHQLLNQSFHWLHESTLYVHATTLSPTRFLSV